MPTLHPVLFNLPTVRGGMDRRLELFFNESFLASNRHFKFKVACLDEEIMIRRSRFFNRNPAEDSRSPHRRSGRENREYQFRSSDEKFSTKRGPYREIDDAQASSAPTRRNGQWFATCAAIWRLSAPGLFIAPT